MKVVMTVSDSEAEQIMDLPLCYVIVTFIVFAFQICNDSSDLAIIRNKTENRLKLRRFFHRMKMVPSAVILWDKWTKIITRKQLGSIILFIIKLIICY